jgi:hypothetical protein
MRLLLENWQTYLNEAAELTIYCDMDGVLVDFELGAAEYITSDLKAGKAPELAEKIGRDYVTVEDIKSNKPVRKYMYKELSDHVDYWANLPWTKNGKALWNLISPYNPNILTTPMGRGSEIGKQAWIDKNLSPSPNQVFMSKDKYLWANKDSILIDDWTKNTIPWTEHDGIAILHSDDDYQKTVNALKELNIT